MTRCLSAVATTALLLSLPLAARAQYIASYFQPGVPGYDRAGGPIGVSYPDPSVQIGNVNVRVSLDESLLFDSNVDAAPGGPSSWILRTSPSVEATAAGERWRLGTAISAENDRYFDTPAQDRTDWTASLGGAVVIGRDELTLGYVHQSTVAIQNQVGAIRSSTPIPAQSDDVRADYSLDVGRFTLSPSVDVAISSFGSATVLGQTIDEGANDNTTVTGAITARYGLDPRHGLLLVLSDASAAYVRQPPGLVDPSSNSVMLLAGADYDSHGVWRYRLLGGLEHRSYDSAQLPTTTTPIVEASVIWAPTGLTTATATVSRSVEQSAEINAGSFTDTSAELEVDHELRRNVLLHARVSEQIADYSLGGSQDSLDWGGGATWLLSPRLRLSADYDDYRQSTLRGGATRGLSVSAAAFSEGFQESRFTLTLHIAL